MSEDHPKYPYTWGETALTENDQRKILNLEHRIDLLEAEQRSLTALLRECIPLALASGAASSKTIGEMRSVVAGAGMDTKQYDVLQDGLRNLMKRMMDTLKKEGPNAD